MKKTIFVLNVGNYAPEITSITYPYLRRYAEKIGASIHTINTRQFPGWDLDYEKLQIYDLIPALGCDFVMYVDSDALVHPELPDLSALIPPDTVAHNGSDFAPIRWRYDDAGYFQRDGRHIGSCNWLACAHRWCRDLWRPLDDLTPEQAYANISLTAAEARSGHCAATHLVSDYALSRNIARFGLKFTTLGDLWKQHGLTPDFFSHAYTISNAEKVKMLQETVARWKL